MRALTSISQRLGLLTNWGWRTSLPPASHVNSKVGGAEPPFDGGNVVAPYWLVGPRGLADGSVAVAGKDVCQAHLQAAALAGGVGGEVSSGEGRCGQVGDRFELGEQVLVEAT